MVIGRVIELCDLTMEWKSRKAWKHLLLSTIPEHKHGAPKDRVITTIYFKDENLNKLRWGSLHGLWHRPCSIIDWIFSALIEIVKQHFLVIFLTFGSFTLCNFPVFNGGSCILFGFPFIYIFVYVHYVFGHHQFYTFLPH